MKLVDVKDKIDGYFESEKGKAFLDEMTISYDILENKYRRFEKWLETNDFDKLMYRIILEHGEDYIENCYHNGYEPYPNNKLNFIFSYVMKHNKIIKVKILDNDFTNNIWEFNGYYFQTIYGQGYINKIYNKDDMRLLLQL